MITKLWQAGTSTGFHSNKINQASVGDVITSRSRYKLQILYLHYQSAYSHQTWLYILYIYNISVNVDSNRVILSFKMNEKVNLVLE